MDPVRCIGELGRLSKSDTNSDTNSDSNTDSKSDSKSDSNTDSKSDAITITNSDTEPSGNATN